MRELGILVTQDPLTCTHLAAPNLVRTKKFLCALASGPTVISTDFIDTCVKKGELPKTDNFLLKDNAKEKAIVEANGGTFAIYSGRPTIKKVNPEDDEGPAEPVYLISGLRPDEKKLWPKFAEMATEGNMIPRIVDTEWLLDVALSQQQKWSESYLIDKK